MDLFTSRFTLPPGAAKKCVVTHHSASGHTRDGCVALAVMPASIPAMGSVPVRGAAAAFVFLATSTAINPWLPDTARAQTVPAHNSISTVSGASATAPVTTFNIPAGSLSDALLSFSTQARAPLTSQAPMLAGKMTSGVQGRFTASQALAHLLQGTGLTYLPTGDHAYKIIGSDSSAIMLGPVRVGGTTGRRCLPPR